MLLPSPPAVVAVVEDGEDDGGAVVDPEVAEGGDDVSMARERKREREMEGVSEGQNKVSRGEFNFSHSLFLNDLCSSLSSSSPCQAVAVEHFEVGGFLNCFIILMNHMNRLY